MLNNNLVAPITTIKQALELIGGLTDTSKMPSVSYSLPADACNKGAILRLVDGSVCSICFALKGNYTRYPTIIKAQYKRLATIGNAQWVEAFNYLIRNKKSVTASKVFRWHDSGDIQNLDHFNKIIQIAVDNPTIRFWLPTKESELIKNFTGSIPKNLVIRLSGSMIDGKAPIYDHTSTVVTNKADATCRSFDNGGKCGDCRMCWDTNVKTISYFKH